MADDPSTTSHLLDTRGYLLRREALTLGLTDRTLSRECRRGRLVRIRQGAYCRADEWAVLADDERLRRRSRASYDLVGGEVALSHTSAAVELGVALWDIPLREVHLTRLDGGSGRFEAGVRHHLGAISAEETMLVDERRVTTPLRTALDVATLTDAERGLVVVDSFLQQRAFTEEELGEAYAARRMWPGSLSLELVTRLARRGSESPGETRTRFLCWQMGFPQPELQYEVVDKDGVLVARVDLAWPELGIYVEFDGKMKYGRLLKPGQDPGDVVFNEKVREDAVRRVTRGTMVRFTWCDLDVRSAPARQMRELAGCAA